MQLSNPVIGRKAEVKKRIQVSSVKGKARRLQNWVAEQVSKITGIPWGKDKLIQGREMGQSGTDLKLYGEAKEKFPFSVECKYQETWSVPSWIKQAKENRIESTDWLLFVKRNRHEEIVIMDAKAFFDLYEQYIQFVFGTNALRKDNKK
jgi:hypothetical protein